MLSPETIEIYRRMTPDRRLAMTLEAMETAMDDLLRGSYCQMLLMEC